MSIARATGILLNHKQASTITLLRPRYASSHSHDHHHEEHHEDATAYPKEDFSSPAWRYFVLCGLGVVGFYKFAPEPSENVYITRLIAHYATPSEVWHRFNWKHLLLSVQGSDEALLMADAKPPPVHRYRYPQRFEQASTHLQPVGQDVDLSNVVVKGDKEYS
ncbi:hypothetical protein BKA93DRAFT_721758 [Sparassis latifolia]|uniref:Uncharacterized protein n=1 Tax=Sparassis crispa TaxID=139825 RepID=A0A401GGE7_9APHY|nr:hypothetical protein SCP_0309940 [Sparassis crispa]GBE81267.1 hypothetical protein SCP_0309940 [Sparassis crispa]